MPSKNDIYLDSSMFGMIAQNGDANEVRAYFDRIGAQVTVSGTNLQEASRAPDKERYERYRVISTVAVAQDKYPGAYLDAQELLSEIRRCRPEWINKIPNIGMVNPYISDHRRKWRSLRSDPSVDPKGIKDNDQFVYKGAGLVAREQKQIRKELSGETPIAVRSTDPDRSDLCLGSEKQLL